MQALVLAAGKGTRMVSSRPKVLHEIFGRPMLDYVLGTLEQIGVEKITLVVGAGADQVRSSIKGRRSVAQCVLQREQKGTGHAVEMARGAFKSFKGTLLIWPGDMPLVKASTLKEFLKQHKKSGAVASVLSAEAENPKGYGRILRQGERFLAIREELDASESERRIHEVNTGIYLFETPRLFEALKKIKPSNSKGEFYLTDTIEVLNGEGQAVEAFALGSTEEGQGINSRADLAAATGILNRREIEAHMASGVTFLVPEQTFVEPGVKIGKDTTVYPWTYIEAGVEIGERCQIGPCAKIRRGTKVGNESVLGSFVEVNRSKIGNHVLAKHLAYLGDAVIGDGTNIGAGVVTANFDGRNKHATKIGKKVLVGSNTVFIAPVNLEDSSKTGAGSVVTAGSKIKKGQVVVGVPAKPLKR